MMPRHFVNGLLIAVLVVAGAQGLLPTAKAHAASFPCTAAKTFVEHAICDHADLSSQDEAVASVYKSLRQHDETNTALDTQRAWLASRNKCQTVGCLRASYAGHLRDSREFLASKTPKPGVTHFDAIDHAGRAIVGSVEIGPNYLKLADVNFPVQLATTAPKFISGDASGPAEIYALVKPMNPAPQSTNRFCDAPMRWLVVIHPDKDSMILSGFSGAAQPTTDDNQACGTYSFDKE